MTETNSNDYATGRWRVAEYFERRPGGEWQDQTASAPFCGNTWEFDGRNGLIESIPGFASYVHAYFFLEDEPILCTEPNDRDGDYTEPFPRERAAVVLSFHWLAERSGEEDMWLYAIADVVDGTERSWATLHLRREK